MKNYKLQDSVYHRNFETDQNVTNMEQVFQSEDLKPKAIVADYTANENMKRVCLVHSYIIKASKLQKRIISIRRTIKMLELCSHIALKQSVRLQPKTAQRQNRSQRRP